MRNMFKKTILSLTVSVALVTGASAAPLSLAQVNKVINAELTNAEINSIVINYLQDEDNYLERAVKIDFMISNSELFFEINPAGLRMGAAEIFATRVNDFNKISERKLAYKNGTILAEEDISKAEDMLEDSLFAKAREELKSVFSEKSKKVFTSKRIAFETINGKIEKLKKNPSNLLFDDKFSKLNSSKFNAQFEDFFKSEKTDKNEIIEVIAKIKEIVPADTWQKEKEKLRFDERRDFKKHPELENLRLLVKDITNKCFELSEKNFGRQNYNECCQRDFSKYIFKDDDKAFEFYSANLNKNTNYPFLGSGNLYGQKIIFLKDVAEKRKAEILEELIERKVKK